MPKAFQPCNRQTRATHILGGLTSVLLLSNNPKPQRGAMFIVSATATSSFVFQRDGGQTSIEMLQIAGRRPAEKQKQKRGVGDFSYKHGTPTEFFGPRAFSFVPRP